MVTSGADLIVKGGLLVDGKSVRRADVLVRDGKVSKTGTDLPYHSAARVIDASGKYVLPGVIDCHAHPGHVGNMRADQMDAFSVCAAFGGVTTIIAFVGSLFASDSEYTPDVVKRFSEEGERISYLDFSAHGFFIGSVDSERAVDDLIDMGVTSFKMFMSDPYSGMMTSDDKLLRVMGKAADAGGLVMVHAENGYAIDYLTRKFMAEGKTGPKYLLPATPNITEAEAFYRAATYAKVTGCPLYAVHLSTREVVHLLRMVRSETPTIFGETCPHYLTMTNDEVLDKGALARVAPPLREEHDVEAMWKAVADGTISTIGSDSVGYLLKHKNIGGITPVPMDEDHPDVPFSGNIFEARAGFNTIEYMVPIIFTYGVQSGRITLPRMVKVLCENPAKIFGLYPRKGALKDGSDADLVVWDPAVRTVASSKHQHGNTDLCSFEGYELGAMPVLTMQRGEIVMENGKVVRPQGRARFLSRDTSKAAYSPAGYSVD